MSLQSLNTPLHHPILLPIHPTSRSCRRAGHRVLWNGNKDRLVALTAASTATAAAAAVDAVIAVGEEGEGRNGRAGGAAVHLTPLRPLPPLHLLHALVEEGEADVLVRHQRPLLDELGEHLRPGEVLVEGLRRGVARGDKTGQVKERAGVGGADAGRGDEKTGAFSFW